MVKMAAVEICVRSRQTQGKIGNRKHSTRIPVKQGQRVFKRFTYELFKAVCFPHFLCHNFFSLSRLLQLEIQLKNESTRPIMHLVDVNGSDVPGITYTADHLNNALVAHNMSKGNQYYWTLPKELLGNKVKI